MRALKIWAIIFIVVVSLLEGAYFLIKRKVKNHPLRREVEIGILYHRRDPDFYRPDASYCLGCLEKEEKAYIYNLFHHSSKQKVAWNSDHSGFRFEDNFGGFILMYDSTLHLVEYYENNGNFGQVGWLYDLGGGQSRADRERGNLGEAWGLQAQLARYMFALDEEAHRLNWRPNPNDSSQMVVAMLLRAWREDRPLSENEKEVLENQYLLLNLQYGLMDREHIKEHWYSKADITSEKVFDPLSDSERAAIAKVNTIDTTASARPSIFAPVWQFFDIYGAAIASVILIGGMIGMVVVLLRYGPRWQTGQPIFGDRTSSPVSPQQSSPSPQAFRLGETVEMGLFDRHAHTYVIGMTGTGKSKAFESWIMQDIEAGRGVGVIDPHGSLVDNLMRRLAGMPEVADRLVLLDPLQDDFVVGLNPLDRLPGETYESQSKALSEIFASIWSEIWPSATWLQEYTSYSAWAMAETGWTMLEIERFLNDEQFRLCLREQIQSASLNDWIDWYHGLKSGQQQQEARSFITRLRQFTDNQYIRPILGQRENTVNLQEVLEAGDKILLVNLRSPQLRGETYQLLGSTVMTLIQLAALGRGDIGSDDQRRFYLYVDEFHTFANKTFVDLLGQIRKFGLTLTLANQDLKQLDDVGIQGLRSAVLGNCKNLTCFRVGYEDDASAMVGQLFTLTGTMTKEERQRWRSIASTIPYRETDTIYYTLQEEKQLFMNVLMGKGEDGLADREFIHRSGTDLADRDTTVFVPDGTASDGQVDDMIRLSVQQQQYARRRDEVEKELAQRPALIEQFIENCNKEDDDGPVLREQT